MRHGSAEIAGGRLHYVRAGSGPGLVLIHGWPMTWELWRPIMPALARDRTVVAVDLPGVGESDPPGEGDYRKRASAERVAALMRHLGQRRYGIVGHDIGGMVAYALAAQYPDAVERLVLSEFWMPGFGLEDGMDVAREGLWHFGFHMQADTAATLTEGKERWYLETVAYEGLTPEQTAPFVRAYERPGRMREGFRHYGTLLQDGHEFRDLAAKGKLAMPVLVLMGGKSMPPERTVAGARAVAEHVEVATVPGSGHWLPLEQPDATARVLGSFLAAGPRSVR